MIDVKDILSQIGRLEPLAPAGVREWRRPMIPPVRCLNSPILCTTIKNRVIGKYGLRRLRYGYCHRPHRTG